MKPSKDKPNRENEILWAKKARSELLNLVCDTNVDYTEIKKDDIVKTLQNNKKLITVKCLEFDKYGRLLVELYNNNKCFNNILVEKNLAVNYDGGHKTIWFN